MTESKEGGLRITSDGLYQELNDIKRDIKKLSEELSYFRGNFQSDIAYINQRVNRFWFGVSVILSLTTTLFALVGGYLITLA